MSRTFATAPGKAVLAGEYVVLEGAPAISMALDRRAGVSVGDVAAGVSSISAPGYADGRWRFDGGSDGRLRWLDEPPDGGLPIVEAAWRRCRGESPVSIVIDTRSFHDPSSGLKIGLGSSAAATTALLAALRAHFGDPAPGWEECRDAHREAQGKRGSGVDIATSFHGGLLRFTMNEAVPAPLRWPKGLEYRLLWSGTPADTAAKLDMFERGAASGNHSPPLARAAAAVADAWQDGGAEALIEALSRYADALRQFSIDRGLGIFDAGHDALGRRARERGLVYKPCGAGGGDIGVVFGTDSARIDAFCEDRGAHGFSRLDVRLDSRGVHVVTGETR